MSHISKLKVFVSSTSDLPEWRRSAESALSGLNIEGLLYENWPSTPNHPLDECLLQINESNAYIVIFGENYGSITESGLSATHLEYRHAIKRGIPIFAYILNTPEKDTEQKVFIKEVETSKFRCVPIKNVKQIKLEIKNSFNQEFARCFKHFHSQRQQPEYLKTSIKQEPINTDILTHPQKTLEYLIELYDAQKDTEIYKYSDHCASLFHKYPDIMNVLYMTESNLAMDGVIAPSARLEEAIEFWGGQEAKDRWANYLLLYNQANALSTLKKHTEAIDKYQQSLAIEDDQAMCWKNLGGAYFEANVIEKATECFEKSLEYNPQLFEALLSLARVEMESNNNPENALAYLNRISVSEISPHRLHSLHSWKAFAYLKQGDYLAGIANAENAISIDDCDRWGWGIAGELYSRIRREDKSWLTASIKFWEKFVDKFQDDENAWAELGFTYCSHNGIKENYSKDALNAFKKAIYFGYLDDGLIFDRIGHIYQDTGNWEDAALYYIKAVKKNPEKFSYCYGVSLIFLGKYSEALPYVLDAATKFNPDAMSWLQVAVCHEKLGFSKKAEEFYKKAIELDPQYKEAWFNLGGLYWNLKNFDNASIVWKEAILKFPNTNLAEQASFLLKSIN